MFLPQKPYVLTSETVCSYLRNRMFTSETVCSYLRNRMYGSFLLKNRNLSNYSSQKCKPGFTFRLYLNIVRHLSEKNLPQKPYVLTSEHDIKNLRVNPGSLLKLFNGF